MQECYAKSRVLVIWAVIHLNCAFVYEDIKSWRWLQVQLWADVKQKSRLHFIIFNRRKKDVKLKPNTCFLSLIQLFMQFPILCTRCEDNTSIIIVKFIIVHFAMENVIASYLDDLSFFWALYENRWCFHR